jgi:hypothetical protein
MSMEYRALLLLALLSATAVADEAGRTYLPSRNAKSPRLHEIRLRDDSWKIGTLDAGGRWTPLPSGADLSKDFFNGANAYTQDIQGVGMAGRSAHAVTFPSESVPAGVSFEANPEDLFTGHMTRLEIPEIGEMYLDSDHYPLAASTFNGLEVELYAELENPSRATALKTVDLFSKLFPVRTAQFRREGPLKIVLLMNKTERFHEDRLEYANGHHFVAARTAVQYTEDGRDEDNEIFEHSLHEFGGLFRIPRSEYAHGLTWMISYDQLEKNAPNARLKTLQRCWDLGAEIGSINNVAAPMNGPMDGPKDFSHNVEYYLDDPEGRGGYPFYAWGSAVLWKSINRELESRGKPSLYALIDSIHGKGMVMRPKNDLDRLLATYKRMAPADFPFFREIVERLFRRDTMADLLKEAKAEEEELGCRALIDRYLEEKKGQKALLYRFNELRPAQRYWGEAENG